MAVAVLSILARHARNGETTSHEELQEVSPLDISDELFDTLRTTGYVVVTEDDRVGLLRDLNITTVADLARDLGLSLGVRAPQGGGAEPCAEASSMSGDLHRMLSELHTAETGILHRSLNDVIFPTMPKIKALN